MFASSQRSQRVRLMSGFTSVIGLSLASACSNAATGGERATAVPLTMPSAGGNRAPVVAIPNAPQPATVGALVSYDASRSGTAFLDPDGDVLTYAITLAPANGLIVSGATIVGRPSAPGMVSATITANDGRGGTATNTFAIVVFAANLPVPALPSASFKYADADVVLPSYYTQANAPLGNVAITDNTPAGNRITNAGAALGRVLFYDRRVSVNDAVSCSSCHVQAVGFADTARLSRGFAGGLTHRHSMGLSNARYYQRGRFFWDERARTLEDQVVTPIQDGTEMGMTLDNLEVKLGLTPYYAPLFTAAFGTPAVTRQRIAQALAQFVRSMESYNAKFDAALMAGAPAVAGGLSAQEFLGLQLFGAGAPGAPPGRGPGGAPGQPPVRGLHCDACHRTSAVASDAPHNNGLDLSSAADTGAGGGRFKAPSLRNLAVRGRFMHDGRFTSLAQVVEFYNSGVQANPTLDPRLRAPNGAPVRFNLTQAEKDALVAYLNTLTDAQFLANPKFANPFPRG